MYLISPTAMDKVLLLSLNEFNWYLFVLEDESSSRNSSQLAVEKIESSVMNKNKSFLIFLIFSPNHKQGNSGRYNIIYFS